MRALGIRSAPQQVRYAIVDIDNEGSLTLVNAETENKLSFPAAMLEQQDQRAAWLHIELSRICDHMGPISVIGVKLPEYGIRSSDSVDKRTTCYADAIAFLVAAERNIELGAYLYSKLKTNSTEALLRAEALVGTTTKYWNQQMADAILAAAYLLNKNEV